MLRPAGLALLLFACSPETPTLPPPAPPAETKSWILSIAHDGEAELFAGPIEEPIVARVLIAHPPGSAEIAYFAEDLSTLRVPAGPIPSPVPGARLRTLPRAKSVARAELDPRAAPAWTEAPWELSRAGTTMFADNAPCSSLSVDVFPLGVQSGARWGVVNGPGEVLAGLGPHLFRLRAEGVIEHRALPFGTWAGAAFRDRGGRLWVGIGGEVLRTTSDLSWELEPIARVDTSTSVLAIAGDPDRPEQDLYVITASGAFAQVSGGAAHIFVTLGRLKHSDVSLVWIGPGHALLGVSTSAELFEVQDGQLSRLPAGDFGVSSLYADAEGGVLIGHVQGEIERWSGAMRATLGRPASQDVEVLGPFRGGFLYGNLYGYVGQWVPGYGFCPRPGLPLVGATVTHILPLDERRFVLLENVKDGVEDATFAVLTAE